MLSGGTVHTIFLICTQLACTDQCLGGKKYRPDQLACTFSDLYREKSTGQLVWSVLFRAIQIIDTNQLTLTECDKIVRSQDI